MTHQEVHLLPISTKAPTVGFEPTQPFGSIGVQDRSLKPLEYVGIYGTPNEIRTRDARMKTVWLNLLPMRAWALRQESNLRI